MKNKTYIWITLVLTLLLLLGFGSITLIVDPLFHYHAPLKSLQYPLFDERYMNYGIVRNFEYDSIITGTSMTENFKVSQFDSYFGTTTVKVPFSGATYHEVHNILEQAFAHNDDIRYVMFSLDPTALIADKDSLSYSEYPDYLYDDNILNDVYYLLNKDIYKTFTDYVFIYTKLGGQFVGFDAYKNWADNYEYDYDKMLNAYTRPAEAAEETPLTDDDIAMLTDNVNANIISLAASHPDTEFYLFIPPYSLTFFDSMQRCGALKKVLDSWQLEARLLLEYDNIHLFIFFDEYEMIADLSNYRDQIHYSQEVSDYIIDCMAAGEHEVTSRNLAAYFDRLRSYYFNYDYDATFSSCER